jgi:hypothetical protein
MLEVYTWMDKHYLVGVTRSRAANILLAIGFEIAASIIALPRPIYAQTASTSESVKVRKLDADKMSRDPNAQKPNEGSTPIADSANPIGSKIHQPGSDSTVKPNPSNTP